jgi:hypothetical protein
MFRFHVSVHGSGVSRETPLAVTFDAALVALQALPRMFIEPDGSFVWTGINEEGQAWQLDGNLIDRGDALAYVELTGSCPEPQFDSLLAALGWPQQRLAFQLPRRGTVLEEAEFRRRAATSEGAI